MSLNENCCILIQISPKKQYRSIESDNGLAPDRQQAIIWTNDGLVYLAPKICENKHNPDWYIPRSILLVFLRRESYGMLHQKA